MPCQEQSIGSANWSNALGVPPLLVKAAATGALRIQVLEMGWSTSWNWVFDCCFPNSHKKNARLGCFLDYTRFFVVYCISREILLETAGSMFHRSLNCVENRNECLYKRRNGARGFQTLVNLYLCSVTFLFNHHVVQYVLYIVCEDSSQPLKRKHKKPPRHHLFAKVPTPTCSSICLKKITNMFFVLLLRLKNQHPSRNRTPRWSPGCTMQHVHYRVLCLCTVDGFLASDGDARDGRGFTANERD